MLPASLAWFTTYDTDRPSSRMSGTMAQDHPDLPSDIDLLSTRWATYDDKEIQGVSIFAAAGGYTKDRCIRACSLSAIGQGCRGISYNTNTGACKTFSSVDGYVDSPGFFSGEGMPPFHWIMSGRIITESLPAMAGPFKLGKSECINMCQHYEGCRYFSWDTINCTLYDVDIGGYQINYLDEACHGRGANQDIIEDGIELVSVNSPTIEDVSSAGVCHAECTWDEGCMYWTYIISERKCYLHNNSDGLTYSINSRLENADAVSGSKRSTPMVLDDTSILPSIPYESLYGQTEDSCDAICARDNQCSFFEFEIGTGTCEFKDGIEGFSSTAGIRTREQALHPFIDTGKMYEGTELDTFSIDIERHCRAGCMFHPECRFYAFNSDDKACKLMSDLDSRTANPSYISGSRPMYPHALVNQRFTASDDQIIGHLTHQVTLLQCQKLCNEHPECVSYNSWDSQCQLLRGYEYLYTDPNCSSGYKPEDDILMKNVELGADGLAHALVAEYTVADDIACAIQCSESLECNFWSFGYPMTTTSNCWLFQSAGEFISASDKLDSVVGSKVCPYWEKEKLAITAGIKTATQPSTKVPDYEYCRDYCASLPDCNYWSFNKRNGSCESYVAYTADKSDSRSMMGASPLRPIFDLPTLAPPNNSDNDSTSLALIIGSVAAGVGLAAAGVAGLTVFLKVRRRREEDQ